MYNLDKTIVKMGEHNCFISEMTVAELKFGVEKSAKRQTLHEIVEAFIPKFTIIPIYKSLDVYAKQKANLRKNGNYR